MSPSEHELGPSWNPDSPEGANNTENVLHHPNLSDLVLLLILLVLPLTILLSVFKRLLLSFQFLADKCKSLLVVLPANKKLSEKSNTSKVHLSIVVLFGQLWKRRVHH